MFALEIIERDLGKYLRINSQIHDEAPTAAHLIKAVHGFINAIDGNVDRDDFYMETDEMGRPQVAYLLAKTDELFIRLEMIYSEIAVQNRLPDADYATAHLLESLKVTRERLGEIVASLDERRGRNR